jgi:hypothetical protein
MSYYSLLDADSKKVVQAPITQFNYKQKFFETLDPSLNCPGYKINPWTKATVIDNETNLLTPPISSKDKIQMQLVSDLDPLNYNIIYADGLKKESREKTGFYYPTKDIGAGRGFGNLNTSNIIRHGNASRTYTKEFREHKESQQLFDYQFQYLDKNFQDPNHIVMTIPRGGDTTRKQNQLSVNAMRKTVNNGNIVDSSSELTKTIKFKY